MTIDYSNRGLTQAMICGFSVPGLDCLNGLWHIVGSIVTNLNSSNVTNPMCQANHEFVGSTCLHAVQKCHKDISEILLHSGTVESIMSNC